MRIEEECCVDCKHWEVPESEEPCCNCQKGISPMDPRHADAPVLWVSEKPDMVNHPGHYETGRFECSEVMVEALGKEIVKGFCVGNAFKYIYRHTRKNGLEDLKKAQWYLNRYIELAEEGSA